MEASHSSEKDTLHCDILILGAGLSGLTLALELSANSAFDQQQILLVDREEKQQNDRTWCFWARPDEPLPPVVRHSWDFARFYGTGFEDTLKLSPFRYCMVRGADFYKYAQSRLAQQSNVRFIQDNIRSIDGNSGKATGEKLAYQGRYLFNSAFVDQQMIPTAPDLWEKTPFSQENKRQDTAAVWMLQHFKGWVIQTDYAAFNPQMMTLMDYRPDQDGDTRFVYVLPLSEREALVEYTAFSSKLYAPDFYDAALKNYINKYLNVSEFSVLEQEFGIIPMSNYAFPGKTGERCINIGTAGGFVKASSGYAFLRTQRKLRKLVSDWVKNGTPSPQSLKGAPRWSYLDSIMLKVLDRGIYSGKDFFTDLFEKTPTALILRFLDEDASLSEIIQVMQAAPTRRFLPVAMRDLWERMLASSLRGAGRK